MNEDSLPVDAEPMPSLVQQDQDADTASSMEVISVDELMDQLLAGAGMEASEPVETAESSVDVLPVTYEVTPENFLMEYVTYTCFDGGLLFTLTDFFFEDMMSDFSRDEAITLLSLVSFDFSVNGVPADGFSVDAPSASFFVPYVEDGVYLLSSDSVGFVMRFSVARVVAVSGTDEALQLLETIQQDVEPHPFLTTNFEDYTVTEGILLLALLLAFISICFKMLKEGFSWL